MEPNTQAQVEVPKKRSWKWIVVLAIVVLLAGWLVKTYNTLISLNEKVNNTWAQVDNQLQRRYDLIPNLVATVKGNTAQEQKIIAEITEARSRYGGAMTPEAKAQAANSVESGLGRLIAIAENYPTLQSSQAFRDLMIQLEGTENRVAVARMDYNNAVTTIDVLLKRFPTNIAGKILGVSMRTYFEISNEAAKNAPEVNFTP